MGEFVPTKELRSRVNAQALIKEKLAKRKGQHHVNSRRVRMEQLALKQKPLFRASVDLDLLESIATKNRRNPVTQTPVKTMENANRSEMHFLAVAKTITLVAQDVNTSKERVKPMATLITQHLTKENTTSKARAAMFLLKIAVLIKLLKW